MNQTLTEAQFVAQQKQAVEHGASPETIVTAVKMDNGQFAVLSRYKEDIWQLPHTLFPSSTCESARSINFKLVPKAFQGLMKDLMQHYYVKGINGRGRATGGTYVNFSNTALRFLRYMNTQFNILRLQDVTQMHCIQYVEHEKSRISTLTQKRLSKGTLTREFLCVETLQILSVAVAQKAGGSMEGMAHPWPESSANHLAGNTGGIGSYREAKTNIIPDEILAPMFKSADNYIQNANRLLKLRQDVDALRSETNYHRKTTKYLKAKKWKGGLKKLYAEIARLLEACMVIILTTTGIRCHELCYIGAGLYHETKNKTGGYYSTIGDDGERYYWLRTISDKTKEGECEFLCTELTHDAMKIAERITAPLRVQLKADIALMQAQNPNDPKTPEKQRHINAVFLGKTMIKNNDITTLSGGTIIGRLKKHLAYLGLNWHLTPHQFRRTFAVYVAKSVHGDLRYLKKHFKHWTLDMTALYALNSKQEEELYNDIMLAMEDERNARVSSWFEEDAVITGGGSVGIKVFRAKNEAVNTFKGRKQMVESISDTIHIRGTGTAWCTADDGGCGGGTASDKTRCGDDCDNAVIDKSFQRKWEGIYEQQIELTMIDDIGGAGNKRVQIDLERCEKVLTGLGVDLEPIKNKYKES